MEEYASSGTKKVWESGERWSVDGKRSTPSQILVGLAKKRNLDAEKADTNAVRKAYITHHDFQGAFLYRKGAQTFKMVSDKAVT